MIRKRSSNRRLGGGQIEDRLAEPFRTWSPGHVVKVSIWAVDVLQDVSSPKLRDLLELRGPCLKQLAARLPRRAAVDWIAVLDRRPRPFPTASTRCQLPSRTAPAAHESPAKEAACGRSGPSSCAVVYDDRYVSTWRSRPDQGSEYSFLTLGAARPFHGRQFALHAASSSAAAVQGASPVSEF